MLSNFFSLPGSGDRDCQDSIEMIQNTRLKDGSLQHSVFENPPKMKTKKIKGFYRILILF